MLSTIPIRVLVLLAALGATLSGQRIRVFSEFSRVGPDGEVAPLDRGPKPREIISPAVPRNGWLTLRLIVELPPRTHYHLFIGQNPDDVLQYTLYQEQYTKVGEDPVPDRLQKLDLPHASILGDEQKVQTYLLDVFVPAKTPQARYRLEAQLNVGQQWVIYPMEIRVRDIAVPNKLEVKGMLPDIGQRADTVVLQPLREYICAEKPAGVVQPLDTVRALSLRNLRQDLVLARAREAEESREGVTQMLVKAGGYENPDAFCKSKAPAPRGSEWWLRARDYLYQGVPIH